MKRFLGLILFLICSMPIYSQSSRLGINLDILTGNEYLTYEIGPSLVFDYHFANTPFAISGKTSFHLSEFSNGNNFSTGYTRTVFNVGAIINYYPISGAIEPYLGLGVFYNSNNISKSGTPSMSGPGIMLSPSNIKNNFSEEINFGINFSANSPINFVVEVSQTFNKPDYHLNITEMKDVSYYTVTRDETFNFNSLFLRLGLYFKI